MQPSRQPSQQPTSQPSRIPTQQPTVQPSIQPTGRPSEQPSRYDRYKIMCHVCVFWLPFISFMNDVPDVSFLPRLPALSVSLVIRFLLLFFY